MLAGVLALAACQATPPRCVLARATELPLRLADGHLLVDAVLNGTPANFILDTGSDATIISTATADRLSIPLIPAGHFEGVGGAGPAYMFLTSSFQLGALHGRQLRLVASDMNLWGARPPDGLLGDNFLSAYDVDLDLPEGKAVLYAASGCTHPAAALPQPLYTAPMLPRPPADLHPVVRVTIGGQVFSAAVDTGAPHTVMFADAARRIGLDIATLKDDYHFRARGVGPAMPAAVRHVVSEMQVGNVYIHNLPVAIIDQAIMHNVDMLLGLDFLSRVHAWFSFSSRTLILQYPPRPSSLPG